MIKLNNESTNKCEKANLIQNVDEPIITYDEQGRIKSYKNSIGYIEWAYHKNGDVECYREYGPIKSNEYVTTSNGITFSKDSRTLKYDNSRVAHYYVDKDVDTNVKEALTFISIRTDNFDLTSDDLFKIGSIVESHIGDRSYMDMIRIEGFDYNGSIVVVEEVFKTIIDLEKTSTGEVILLDVINNTTDNKSLDDIL